MVYVKSVLIQGFKSYKDQMSLPEFDPRHNVIVGRNGSGKSNFFAAIRFVLSDLFSNLRPEERQTLLHEGTGNTTVSGFVEIVFDNSDGRFPVEQDEVLLRRSIGLKKDEYFLNLKHVTKSDVVSLLESAGFSRSNPYYIVQQGRVNALSTMKDKDRLELLKEVAGTSVYDKRREESQKIMIETEQRREKILKIIDYIDERLGELGEEKEELSAYQDLDKERRCIDYALYDKELNETVRKIQQIEAERDDASQGTNQHSEELQQIRDTLAELERELRVVKTELEEQEGEKRAIEGDRGDDVKARARAELRVQELEESNAAEEQERADLQAKIEKLEEQQEEKTALLEEKAEKCNEALDKEFELKQALQEAEEEQLALQSREGRRQQFSNRQERDEYLADEIAKLGQEMIRGKEQSKAVEADIAKSTKELQQLDKKEKVLGQKIEERQKLIDQTTKDISDLTSRRNDAQNLRKSLWREDQELGRQMANADEERRRGESELQSTMNRSVSEGLRSVQRLVHEHSIDGVYGPLIDLFSCNEKLYTAVEVTAGNSLFDIVVEDSAIASKLIGLLNKEKGGRVSFLPLKDLRPRDVKYPEGQDVIPMIDRLEIANENTRVAFKQVFGRTLICRTLEVASQMARESDLNCVTLDGDKVNNKGAMTGGYHDRRASRLNALRVSNEALEVMEEAKTRREGVKERLDEVEQRITQIIGDIEKVSTRRGRNAETIQELNKEVENLPTRARHLKAHIDERGATLKELQLEAQRQQDRKESLEKEMNTDIDENLSNDDAERLMELTKKISEMTKNLAAHKVERVTIEMERDDLQERIDGILGRQLGELRQTLAELGAKALGVELDIAREELARTSSTVDDSMSQVKDINKKIQELESRQQELDAEIEGQKAREQELEEEMQGVSKAIEKLVSKHNLLLSKKNECMLKIRDLGPLAGDAREYTELSLRELERKKQQCTRGLKKFAHVNKKALDQFVNFTDQRKKMIDRKAEMDKDQKSIEELIEVLDMRKDEAIERTFRGVAKNFREVFKELVPSGHADLVMQKKRARPEPVEGEEEEELDDESRIGQYKGIAIRASFTGAGDPSLLNQLSGGQKCLVALTLIFAIQRCDPAPFYLFDEIDAALDSAHRQTVAQMIQKQSAKAQFITTTFRPEFLNHADRFYGVTFSNKISRVGLIDHDQAMTIITEDAQSQQGA